MIKGIIGYRVDNHKDIEPILLKLRSHAMQYPGFVSAENLVSDVDSTVVVMTSTWMRFDDWNTWLKSRITQDLVRFDKDLLSEKPRVTSYRIMPTADWR